MRNPLQLRLLLLQTKTDSRCRRTFHAIRRAAARTQHGDERFARFARHSAICLNRAEAGWRCLALITFIALRTGCTLRTLRALCSGRALRTGHALNSLGALRPRCALGARIALRPLRAGITAAAADHQCNADYENWKDLHDAPPVDLTLSDLWRQNKSAPSVVLQHADDTASNEEGKRQAAAPLFQDAAVGELVHVVDGARRRAEGALGQRGGHELVEIAVEHA